MNFHSDCESITNDSGFPLQIALQHAVSTYPKTKKWSVARVEHAWKNQVDNTSGFIDLVVRNENNAVSLVVECKRVKDAAWVFLNSNGIAGNQRAHIKSWISCFRNNEFSVFDWVDIDCDPAMPEAHFCALKGQSINDKNTLLERTSAALVSSTEALAIEERDYRRRGCDSIHMYFNVVVTTAEIGVGEFDPADISLKDGMISEPKFEKVPYLQVRKQFSVRPKPLTHEDWETRHQPYNSRENTVFVVQAAYFEKFLDNFYVPRGKFEALFTVTLRIPTDLTVRTNGFRKICLFFRDEADAKNYLNLMMLRSSIKL